MAVIAEREVLPAPSPESFRAPFSIPRPSLEKLNSLRVQATSVASKPWPEIKHHSIDLVAAAATYVLTENAFLTAGALLMTEHLVSAAEEIIGDRLKPHPFQDGVLR